MKLVIFDLDTALCQTNIMDGMAMASAIKDVANIEVDAESIASMHDLKSLWYKITKTVASTSELQDLRDRFGFHLRRQFLIRPSVVSANYALVSHVNSMQDQSDVVVGLVSSMSLSVINLKANAIGLLSNALPIATGEDSDSPSGILNTLQTRVKRSYGISIRSTTLVANDQWLKSANKAGIELILADDYVVKQKQKVKPLIDRSLSQLNWR